MASSFPFIYGSTKDSINAISGDGNYGVRIEEADAADATSIRYAMTGHCLP